MGDATSSERSMVLENEKLRQRVAELEEALARRSTPSSLLDEEIAARIPVGLVVVSPEGRWLAANEKFCEVVGCSREGLEALSWPDLSPPSRHRRELAIYLRMLAGKIDRYTFEHTYLLPDGRQVEGEVTVTLVSHADGSPRAFVAVVKDITERRRAERALQDSEATVRSMLQAVPVGVGTTVDRIITGVNDRLCGMLGYTAEELVGQSARMLYPDDESFEWVGREKYRQIGEHGVGTVETRWRRKDGSLFDLLLSSAPIGPVGPGAGVVFTVLDITERKRGELERRRLEKELRHVQKLESLGVLAGGIAHDFNNLLTAILGNADLAAMSLPEDAPPRKNLREISKASQRAAELCHQMLAYSGRSRLVLEPLDLSKVVQKVSHLLELAVPRKSSMGYRLAADLPEVEADDARIRQVIMNLVANASEALGNEPGSIVISTGVMECDARITSGVTLHGSVSPGRCVFLEVADTGAGMAAETRDRIFDPFFSTRFPGRGLGLAAVSGIVRGHGGAILVSSELGRGSSFKVVLPVRQESASRGGAENDVAEAWQGSGTVLVADDEEAIREVVTVMLEHLGFRVLAAADGIEALRVFREQGSEIACVILDVSMPGMSGEDALQGIRGVNPTVPVVMSSGHSQEEIVRRLGGKGMTAFIQKPYTLDAIGGVLKRVLRRAAS